MQKSIVAVILGCALAGAARADGLGASAGMDTLSFAGGRASVPVVGIASATHFRGVGVSTALRVGHGQGTSVEAWDSDITMPGSRIDGVSVSPVVRLAAVDVSGPGSTGVSLGYATVGAQATARLAPRVTVEGRADAGMTFLGSAVTSTGTASGSGTVSDLSMVLAYRVSHHSLVAVSYLARRLPVGPVALEDHSARVAYLYRF